MWTFDEDPLDYRQRCREKTFSTNSLCGRVKAKFPLLGEAV